MTLTLKTMSLVELRLITPVLTELTIAVATAKDN